MSVGVRLKRSLLVRPPKWWFRLFHRPTWRFEVDDQSICFTFDDGPIPEITPWILDTLEAHDARATFFCVGDNVRKHPELFAQIKSAGHAVGNHTYSHLNGFRTGIRRYVWNVYKAHRLIGSRLFRPPYGRANRWVRNILLPNFYIIMWDVLSMDYDAGVTPEQVVENVIENAQPGSIVVFHDNIKARENLTFALPRLLKHYKDMGYQFRTIEEMIKP